MPLLQVVFLHNYNCNRKLWLVCYPGSLDYTELDFIVIKKKRRNGQNWLDTNMSNAFGLLSALPLVGSVPSKQEQEHVQSFVSRVQLLQVSRGHSVLCPATDWISMSLTRHTVANSRKVTRLNMVWFSLVLKRMETLHE